MSRKVWHDTELEDLTPSERRAMRVARWIVAVSCVAAVIAVLVNAPGAAL